MGLIRNPGERVRIQNHTLATREITSKLKLLLNMQRHYKRMNKDVFRVIPPTFWVRKGEFE